MLTGPKQTGGKCLPFVYHWMMRLSERNLKIGYIGGGNMASALIGGMIAKGWRASDIYVADIVEATRERLREQYSVNVFERAADAAAPADAICFAVKPQQMSSVAQEIAGVVGGKLVLSIAAGIPVKAISSWFDSHRRIVRIMPNTPALVREGVSAVYALPDVTAAERNEVERMLSAVGRVVWVEDESLMDAVTAISGSGPAYVFYLIEAMHQAAIELGFSESVARELTLGTVKGAAHLAVDSAETAATLRARVTSKGGTTEAAMALMESNQVKQRIVDAIHAAQRRSRELGEQFGAK